MDQATMILQSYIKITVTSFYVSEKVIFIIIYKFSKLINFEHNLIVLNTDQIMRSQDEVPVFSFFIAFSL